jgi:glycerol-3-phosphate dehydrogenase (NAD(P)+)
MGVPVALLGAGSWGTALAIHLGRLGHPVRLWTRDAAAATRLADAREHASAHPGVRFPDEITPTSDLRAALTDAGAAVLACPSHALRAVAEAARPHLRGDALIASTAKGIEQDTDCTMSVVLEQVLGAAHYDRISVLSGPSFAREVASGMPTAVTAGARTEAVAQQLQQLFNGPTFRVYTSTDVVGVEIGGAVKNVIAVAAGVSDGLGFGTNTRAALITRGLAEISRLAVQLGADRQTLYGLSGLGDLVLTCTGDLSRNRSVGLRLGRGETLSDILASMSEVAEGVRNTRAVHALAARVGVEMPITRQMFEMLYENKSPMQAVVDLMTRRLKREDE